MIGIFLPTITPLPRACDSRVVCAFADCAKDSAAYSKPGLLEFAFNLTFQGSFISLLNDLID